MSEQKQEIYYHVGLGKVASTYFQYRFFPKLKGIYYIQRTKYRRYPKIIENCDAPKILLSNESEGFYEKALKQYSSLYPDGKIIMVMRRTEGWLASQYRRQVKNGRNLTFKEFIDVENNTGEFKRENFYFSKLLELTDKYIKQKPLILFYDDFIKDNYATFDKMAEYMGVTYDRKDVSLDKKHTSYSEKQLKAVKKMSKYLYVQDRKFIRPYLLRKISNHFRRYKSYVIMWFALLIPNAWMSKEPLIPKDELEKVRKFYEEDWQKCLQYAKDLETRP